MKYYYDELKEIHKQLYLFYLTFWFEIIGTMLIWTVEGSFEINAYESQIARVELGYEDEVLFHHAKFKVCFVSHEHKSLRYLITGIRFFGLLDV